jgi:SAM-dependent methyltransferase
MTRPAPEVSDVAQRWRAELAAGGYERRLGSRADFRRLERISRTWRAIFTATRLARGARVFEFGCGGGNQLVLLGLLGFRGAGIDCSPEVLARCRALIADAERFTGRRLDLQLFAGDFLDFSTPETYDLVFNFGVVEHFLDDGERARATRRMVELCAPGGHVVSVVPSGTHPLRARMKAEGLGGYRVPEVDYTPASLEAEMRIAGAVDVRVLPHNLFGYRLIDPAGGPARLWNRLAFYAGQALPRRPSRFAFRHASTLIAIGRTP